MHCHEKILSMALNPLQISVWSSIVSVALIAHIYIWFRVLLLHTLPYSRSCKWTDWRLNRQSSSGPEESQTDDSHVGDSTHSSQLC